MKLFFTAVFFAATVLMSVIAQADEGQSAGGVGHRRRDSDLQFTKWTVSTWPLTPQQFVVGWCHTVLAAAPTRESGQRLLKIIIYAKPRVPRFWLFLLPEIDEIFLLIWGEYKTGLALARNFNDDGFGTFVEQFNHEIWQTHQTQGLGMSCQLLRESLGSFCKFEPHCRLRELDPHEHLRRFFRTFQAKYQRS